MHHYEAGRAAESARKTKQDFEKLIGIFSQKLSFSYRKVKSYDQKLGENSEVLPLLRFEHSSGGIMADTFFLLDLQPPWALASVSVP
jgi:hypothetical protein